MEDTDRMKREHVQWGKRGRHSRALILMATVPAAAVGANYFATNYVGAPANYYDYKYEESTRKCGIYPRTRGAASGKMV